MLEAHAARKAQPENPVFGGLGFTTYSGVFGLRLSGGLNLFRRPGGDKDVSFAYTQCDLTRCQNRVATSQYHEGSKLGIGGWMADADVLLEPFRPWPVAKSLLLGFSPYGFFGIGGYGVRPLGVPDTALTTLSYGVGVHHDVLSWFGVGAEARYRRPIRNDSSLTFGTPRSWEYRLGLTVSFGSPSVLHRRPRYVATSSGDVEKPRPPRPTTTTTRVYIYESDASSKFATRILSDADEYLGTRFRSGGSSPRTGFDGPGFVQYVFWREGVRLPSSARRMANMGEPVSTRVGALRPGDLLFFANDGYNINHVAIYVGHDRIIHATSSGSGVRYDVLGDGERGRWFAGHLVAARRVIRNERVDPYPYPYDDPDYPDRAPRPSRWP
jgi:cell wall-associated NlpC family hydrolase